MLSQHRTPIDTFIFLLSASLGAIIIYWSANNPPGWFSDFLLSTGTGIITIGFTVVLVDMVRKRVNDSQNWIMLTSAYVGMFLRGSKLLSKLMNITHPNVVDRFIIKQMSLHDGHNNGYSKAGDIANESRITISQLRKVNFLASLKVLTVNEIEELRLEFDTTLTHIEKVNENYATAFSDPYVRNLFVNLAVYNRGVVSMLSVRISNLKGKKGVKLVPIEEVAGMINIYLATYDAILIDYINRNRSHEKRDRLKKIVNRLIASDEQNY